MVRWVYIGIGMSKPTCHRAAAEEEAVASAAVDLPDPTGPIGSNCGGGCSGAAHC